MLDVSPVVAEETTDVSVEAIQAAERGGGWGVSLCCHAFFVVLDPGDIYVLNVNLCVSIFGGRLENQDKIKSRVFVSVWGGGGGILLAVSSGDPTWTCMSRLSGIIVCEYWP